MDYKGYRDQRLAQDPVLRRWYHFYTRWYAVRRVLRWILFGVIE